MKTISAPLQVTYKIMVKATAYVRIDQNELLWPTSSENMRQLILFINSQE